MILDMMCHWRYVLDNLFGQVQSITCLGATHIPQRWDEAGRAYAATADDAAYATFQLRGEQGEPVIAQVNSSWTTRVRRDDLVTFHVDGTHGSAVAGLQDCRAQSRVATPRPVWNPDVKQAMNFFDQWQEVPDTEAYDNGFKAGPENHWGPEVQAETMVRICKAVDHPGFGVLLHLRGNPGDALIAPWAMHTHLSYDIVMNHLETSASMLQTSGYQGCWSVEHHSGKNEYSEVAVQLARVRAFLSQESA